MKKSLTNFRNTVASRVIVVVLIIIALLFASTVTSSLIYSSLMDTMFEKVADTGIGAFEVYIESLGYDKLASQIGCDLEYMNSFESRDAAALQAVCERDAKRRKDIDDNEEHITFTGTAGKVIYSTNGVFEVDQDLSSYPHIKKALAGSVGTDYVTNYDGAEIAYVTASPIKDLTGKMIGTISFTFDLSNSEFLDELTAKTNNQYTIFLDTTRIATTLKKQGTGERIVGDVANEAVIKTVKEQKKDFVDVLEIEGTKYASCYRPIFDGNGKYLGMIFSGEDVGTIYAASLEIRWICIGVVLLLGIFGVVITLRVIRKSVTEPLAEFTRLVDELEGCEIAKATAEIDIDTNDKTEVGHMARGLVGMSNSFANITNELVKTIESLAEGDLTVKYNRSFFRGDFSRIDAATQRIISSLNGAMSKVNISAAEVASGAEEVSSGAQALSQGSTQQASEIEQLSNIIKDITEKISSNARNATEASGLTNTTHDISLESQESMRNLSNAMLEINEVTSKMEKIVKTIDNFAFQTNILALNAAVEAARAGVYGRGFAVVAEEVRSLASKSADAAKETGDLIESTVQIVESGVMLAQETNDSFEKVVNLVDDITKKVESIADASNEQAMSVSHIATSVDEITKVVQTNSATAEESAAASEELSSISQVFKEIVGKFKVDQSRSYDESTTSAATPSQQSVSTPVRDEFSVNTDVSYSSSDDKYF